MLSRSVKTGTLGLLVALAALPLPLFAAQRAAPPASALVPGEVLRYRLEYRSTIESASAGPIYTPEAAHQMDVSLSARLRLAVLSAKSGPPFGRLTRLRVTYETSDAQVRTDAYDPGAQALEKQYRALAGRSFEFSIDEQGRVREVAGLAQLEPDERARSAVRQWLTTLALPLGLWRKGVQPGKKWSRVVPLANAPLAGLAWRTRSVYSGNQPCPLAPGAPGSLAKETCGVIETRIETVREPGFHNLTPLAYSRQGLRTKGSWTGRGESRNYVSLATGLVTESTATDSDVMNLTITAVLSGSSLHYAGRWQSSSQLTLVGFQLPRVAPLAP